jgi:hypothetical protein
MARDAGGWRGEAGWLTAAVALSLAGGAAAGVSTTVAVAIVAAAVFLLVALRWPHIAVPTLILIALLLSRPTIPGGRYQTEGIAVAVVAAFIALVTRRERWPLSRSARRLLLWTFLLWTWTVCLALMHSYYSLSQALKGAVAVLVVVGATAIVCAELAMEQRVIKLFIGVIGVLCASAVVTYVMLLAGGVVSLGQVPNYAYQSSVDLSAPFTVTTAEVQVLGRLLPRFLGIAREPGLMQGFIVGAYFLLGRVGWDRRRWLKVVLAAGLLATLSTTGIAVFVIAWLVWFALGGGLRQRGAMTLGRLIFLMSAFTAGVWAVLNLPVLGLTAKSGVNAASVDDRYNNGVRGLAALLQQPLGGLPGTDQNSSINLIAAISMIGALGFLVVIAAFWLPLTVSAHRRTAIAVVLPLFITTLLSEPTLDSPTWWVLVLFAVGAARAPVEQADAPAAGSEGQPQAGHVVEAELPN